MRFFAAAATCLSLALPAAAQDRPNTILVMDGSGSMWGQIDGVAKITIAQEVVGGLLDSIPGDQRLGLTVYGHRERGNCTDIETIVAPGENTRDQIRAAVNGIQPLGKTPMTDAIIAAAEALRYTEDSATVILVSDGVETCNPDPCAAARLLEQAGIDFTAHVVGFDVQGDAAALTQMQCIADETGGMFIPAANADELAEALNTVVEEPEWREVTLRAVLGREDGPLVEGSVVWSIFDEGNSYADNAPGNPLDLLLEDGRYSLTAYWIEGEAEVEGFVTVAGATTQTIVFPEPTPQAAVTAPATAPSGSTIAVGWTGPQERNDFISVRRPDATGFHRFVNTNGIDSGNPVQLLMPVPPGEYVIEYIRNETREPLAATTITITPVEVSVAAQPQAVAGETIPVTWSGPAYTNDFIAVRHPESEGFHRFVNTSPTEDGSPLQLLMPASPGTYVIEYINNQDRVALAATTITLTPAEASVSAPETAGVGSRVAVDWTGPDYRNDFIAIRSPDSTGFHRFADSENTRDGTPVTLNMPTTPGEYVIEYIEGQDRTPLAAQVITVSEVQSALVAPESAPAGALIQVGWDGPDNDRDYISVGVPGERYVNYTYTSEGNPVELRLPPQPGAYEIRYQLAQGGEIIATKPITVTEVPASLVGPDSAAIGSTITVGWEGPDYAQDYIAIGSPGERYATYTYTREGNPVDLVMPSEPGSYELRYELGQGGTIIATRPIEVVDIKGALTAPDTAPVGSTISVGWDGPDNANDFISVGLPGERYMAYSYTREGNPVELVMPTEPGIYQLRYQLRVGEKIIATKEIMLTETQGGLVTPPTAPAGSTLTIAWDGPAYDNDYIAVATGETDRAINYTRVREGNPLELLLPVEPGDYVISYRLAQGDEVLAANPITLTEVKAQLTVPQSATAGETLSIGWDGPGYTNDYIGIATDPNARTINYVRVRDGNPVALPMPPEPGDYHVFYRTGQRDRVLFTQPIALSDVSATVTAPATARIGEMLSLDWDGPDYPNDYLGVSTAPDARATEYTRTREGNPLQLRMPSEPGTYHLFYRTGQGDRVLWTKPVTVESVKAQLVAPDSVAQGEDIVVGWDGPAFPGDRIHLFDPARNRATHNQRTDQGNPVTLAARYLEPGSYEIRYQLHDGTVLARREFSVTE